MPALFHRTWFLLAVTTATAIGCAVKFPPRVALDTTGDFPEALVVGVRDPYPDGEPPLDLTSEKLDAVRLVNALRATRLFAEVDFTHKLQAPPQIQLVAGEDPHSNLTTNEQMLLSMFTLGAWPAYGRFSRSLHFSVACGSEPKFQFPYYTTEFGGWFSLVVLPSEPWRWGLSKDRDPVGLPVPGRGRGFESSRRQSALQRTR